MSSQFAVVVEPLSDAERAELAAIEIAIEDGLRGFAAMGARLLRVRDGRLYRGEHATFEDYCRERWGFSRQTGYDLIQTASMDALVQEVGQVPALTREQARELIPLRDDPSAVTTAMSTARERFGPKPSAAQTREVVHELMPTPPPRKDMRFENIEDALRDLQDMPDPSAILWPVDEPGDIQMVEEALVWIEAWLPKAKASWKAHKALLPKELRPKTKRKLRVV